VDWFARGGTDPMFGMYDDAERERCPVCYVPIGAPHMNSCRYAGTWRGDDREAERRAADESDY
jgi:hypothetical protein